MKKIGARFVFAIVLVGVPLMAWLLLRLPQVPVPTSSGPGSTAEPPTSATAPSQEPGFERVTVPGGGDSDPEAPVGTPARMADSGALHLVSDSTMSPASPSEWRLVGDEDELVCATQSDGTLSVPAGSWTLRSLDNEWIPPREPVSVEPDSELVVWVEPRTTRQFRVVDSGGTPVQGVMVAWRSRTFGDLPPRDGADGLALRETDATGRAVLDDGSFSNGKVTFLHEDLARVELSLCGPPEEDEVDVVMWPSPGDRLLRFVLGAGSPSLSDLVVTSTEGFELARSERNSDTARLPGWLRGNEPVRVTSPLTFPSQLRLNDLSNDTVVLPGRVSAVVLVDDQTGCESLLSLSARPSGTQLPSAVEPILVGEFVQCRSGEEVRLEFPEGHALRLLATNECGASADSEFLVERTQPATRLSLRASRQLEVLVREENGRGIDSASANVMGLGTFRADATGVVRVPITPLTHSIRVSAPGHGTAVVSRLQPEDSSGTQTESLEVVLPKSGRLVVRVESTENRALAGMRVRAWPKGARTPTEDGGRWGQGRVSTSVSAITDGNGRCILADIDAGDLRIEVDLPPVVGTDPWKRSAFPPYRFERRVLDNVEVTLNVPAPVQLRLRVTHNSTGAPVPAFTLLGQGATVPPVEVSGGYWQGWVSSSLSTFQVTVQALGTTSFALDPKDGEASHSIRVGPQGAITLRITGLPGAVRGTRVVVQYMQQSADGYHLVQSTEAILDERGEAPLAPGGLDAEWISIAPIESGGKRWGFSPEVQPVMGGTSLVFAASPSEN